MINYLNPNFNNTPTTQAKNSIYKLSESKNSLPIDVSIITPYYNAKEFFFETFTSVLSQSLQNWEWVIVDDGSTDMLSVDRLTQITKDEPRIKIIRQMNGGTAAARNTGFRHSTGRNLCLLDHDDMLEPTYLEKCVWFLDSNSEYSFCNSYNVFFGMQEFLWTAGYERGEDYLEANSAPPISVIRRAAYQELGGFDETIKTLYEDWDFWLAMANIGHWGFTIPEYLQWYRKLESGRYEKILESGYQNSDFSAIMKKKYPGLVGYFPTPRRKSLQPYDKIQNAWLVNNQLQPNTAGRRIMFIVPWMVIGGADRVNLDLIEGLVGKGHQVTVCATLHADHKWEYKYSELTPDIFVLPNILTPTDYPRFLAYLIQSRVIDTVIITGSILGYQLLPYLRASAPHTAFVDMSHVEEIHWLNGGHPRFGTGYQDALDLNVVTSAHLVDWMTGRGADPDRIRVIHTGIKTYPHNRDEEERKIIRARFGIKEGLPVIVFAGRLCEQKRPGMLAEIMKEARDAGFQFQALIIGDGELKPMFEALIKKYKLHSCVRMIGALAHDRWLEVLVASDIMLMPSQYEGVSIALLEAMAAGVVPVVARVGGQGAVVTEDVGYLISRGDRELQDYVLALGKLIHNSADLKIKSKACQQLIASTYSWERSINEFNELLTEAHDVMKNRSCQFSLSIARELASLALENMRLSDVGSGGWNKQSGGDLVQTSSLNVAHLTAGMRLASLLFQTRIARSLARNEFIKKIGRRLLSRLENF
ncbi:MAG: glycosyltransferase [Rhodoferax sp.]|uniref:glycosyltransferase n=1 Tax=Rhodoferax sp. TaxID=50421 RepID=UPI003266546C